MTSIVQIGLIASALLIAAIGIATIASGWVAIFAPWPFLIAAGGFIWRGVQEWQNVGTLETDRS